MTEARRATVGRVRAAAPTMTRTAVARLGELRWFAVLSADVRSTVGLVVAAGVEDFVRWLDEPAAPRDADPFGAVPAAAARAISLEQTVELIRVALEAIEDSVPQLAAPGAEDWLTTSIVRYARELAFAVARVYARAAEQRGAWDARLQALLVDALLDDADERVLTSRATALSWPVSDPVRGLASLPPDGDPEHALREANRAARRLDVPVLAAVHGGLVLAVLPAAATSAAAQLLPGSPVIGPEVPGIARAGLSLRAALAGVSVLPAWRGASGPLLADTLLPERVLAGDGEAANTLIEAIYKPLLGASPALLVTLDALLAANGSLEAAARALPVHVNTLRYRLSRIEEITGRDPRQHRDRLDLELALVLGRLAARPGAL